MASNEEIEAAIERLAARGDAPSVRRVWDEFGKSGSFSQINPVLSAGRKAQAAKADSGSPVQMWTEENRATIPGARP